MTAPRHELNDRLVAAVTARDPEAVRAALDDGADPDTPGPDGLPPLCTALAGFDHESARALTEGGADPDRELPDGTTPLLRAVDLGSPVLVGAVRGKDPRLRIPEGARRRMLDLARHWHETGEAEELRRRTGAAGAAVRRLVQDDEYTEVEEVSLGGLTVRAAAVTQALAALLDEEEQLLRLEAAYSLALRDDPRTDWAFERVGPLGPGFEHDHRVAAHWHYQWRNRPDRS